MIGISGMRGIIGSTLSPAVVTQYASAFAAYLKANEKPNNGAFFRVVLGAIASVRRLCPRRRRRSPSPPRASR